MSNMMLSDLNGKTLTTVTHSYASGSRYLEVMFMYVSVLSFWWQFHYLNNEGSADLKSMNN